MKKITIEMWKHIQARTSAWSGYNIQAGTSAWSGYNIQAGTSAWSGYNYYLTAPAEPGLYTLFEIANKSNQHSGWAWVKEKEGDET